MKTSELISRLKEFPPDTVVATGEPTKEEGVALHEQDQPPYKIAVIQAAISVSIGEWAKAG